MTFRARLQSRIPRLTLLALIALVLACGDDASSPPPLATDKRLSDLTFQEAIDLCGHFDRLTVGDPEYVRGSCSQVALLTLATDPGQSCEEVRDTCDDELVMNRICWLDPRRSSEQETGCETTTASELTSCLEALAADTKQRYAGVTCDDPSSAVPLSDASAAWQDLKDHPLPGCEPLAKSCPEFFDSPEGEDAP